MAIVLLTRGNSLRVDPHFEFPVNLEVNVRFVLASHLFLEVFVEIIVKVVLELFVKDPIGFLKHLTAEAPVFMWPIMVPVEIMGMLIKPFALAIRCWCMYCTGVFKKVFRKLLVK